ncbi:MAG: ATP phosphoribosyltransferase regulatory subunit [Clostridia bacterium]|nr:ATP phosphoribosyltransferase regulatory subunit [Clostridia bacterium]
MNNDITSALNALYDRYGYCRYKMSKFEEYDLYAKNKDFLISDGVITFTDRNGKLMALKPDVTLSIVKNTCDGKGVQKLYYNENVYRVSKSTKNFKEIMQVGLECIGDIDEYCIAEALTLAAASLGVLSENAVLCVSDLDILSQTLEFIGVGEEKRREAFGLIGEKNLHGLRSLTDEEGFELIKKLLGIRCEAKKAAEEIEKLLGGAVANETLSKFSRVMNAVSVTGYADKVTVDLSVVDDIHYYNGFVFKGYVEGAPAAVLSGGQYDRLMAKMKRSSEAIGFAVYLDLLDQLNGGKDGYDCDVLFLYSDEDDIEALMKNVDLLVKEGYTVSVRRSKDNVRSKKTMKICGGEVKTVE